MTEDTKSSTSTTIIGQYLLDRLYDYGLRHMFGIPGDYIIRFNKLVEEHPIEFINATRENTAGYMADAYARIQGIGAACITYGVGINIVNAVSQAYVEGSPLVIISGAMGTQEGRKGNALHHLINEPGDCGLDTTQRDILRHVTISQAILDDPFLAQLHIDTTLDQCVHEKKPVYIELPRDCVHAQITPSPDWPVQGRPETNPKALDAAIAEVHQALETSKYPIIWAGHEVRNRGLSQALLRFAEARGIPIVSSLLGKTVIDEHHPLFVGVYQGEMSRPEVLEVTQKCDCALVLGVMLSDIDTGMFTADLYEFKQVVAGPQGVSIGYHCYPDVRFEDFLNGLWRGPAVPLKLNAPSASSLIPEAFEAKAETAITSKRVFDALQSFLDDDCFLVTDVGDCLFGATDLVLHENSFMASAYFATLGFGTPGAVGAQVALPNKRVIGLVGDGAFQMTATELSTAARYGLDPIIIVLNNHGYGTERPLLEGAFNDIQNWNYSKIPDVIGAGVGLRVTTEEEFRDALTRARADRGTLYVIEVELGKTDFSPAMERFSALVSKRI